MSEMTQKILKYPAEQLYASELQRLKSADKGLVPPGWQLSARSVRAFIVGDKTLDISRKFYGDDALIERAIVGLMGEQGLMLVGEPGTAKSMLSELLSAAICGSSMLVVQGAASTIEDHVRYGWNYALLLAEGPSRKALVPSPVLTAMRHGHIVRIEELTRCPAEVQDLLISILSEKVIMIPELGGDGAVYASPGFNIIGTANLRDRGVNDMSSALKRRFNFETVYPISDTAFEKELIRKQLDAKLKDVVGAKRMDDEVLEVLVSTFHDLRNGKTADGTPLSSPNAVMSTAEAVNIAHAASLDATYLGQGTVDGSHIARQLVSVIIKDDAEDGRKFKTYVDHVARDRAKQSKAWASFYEAARKLRLL